MRRNSLILCLVVACSILQIIAPSLVAQSRAAPSADDGTEQPEKLEETIVVTATRTERIASDVPVSATVLLETEIEETPAFTVDNILRTVAGLNFPLFSSQNVFASLNRLSMRGLGGDRTLVLLDGVPINDPYRGYVQWNKIPRESLRRIEVIRGASANLFGNYALGGTINLITRPVQEGDLRLDASYGSHETGRYVLGLNHMISPRVGLGIDAVRHDSDGYMRSPSEERGSIDIPAASESTTVVVRADATRAAGDRFFVRTSYFEDEISLGTPLGTSTREIFDAALGGTLLPAGDNIITFTTFYQDAALDTYGLRIAADRNSEQRTSISLVESNDIGASAQWSTTYGARLPFFSIGIDVRRIEADDISDRLRTDGSVSVTEVASGRQTSSGLFSQLSWQPVESIEVLAGARADWWKNSDGLRMNIPGDTTRFEEKSSSEASPRVAVRWEISDRLSFRSAVYRGFKAPTIRELYRDAAFGRQVVLANPLLDSETLVGGEIGFDISSPALRAQINVFRNDVDDLISRVPLQFEPILILQIVNLGETRSQGVELITDYRLTRSWSLNGSYAYTDATVVSNPQDPSIEGNMIPDIPRHAGALSARYRHHSGTTLTVRGRSESRRFFDAENVLTLDAATIFDFSADYPVGDRIEVFLIGENLFDKEYVVDRGAQNRIGDPRQFFAGVRFRYPLEGSTR